MPGRSGTHTARDPNASGTTGLQEAGELYLPRGSFLGRLLSLSLAHQGMETAKYGNTVGQAVEGALRAFGQPLGAEAVEQAASRLLELTPAQRRISLAHRHPSSAILILRRLLLAGYGFRHAEPRRYLEAATVAVHLAARLPARGPHRPIIEDLRSEAWAHLANAWRIQEDLPATERAFTSAEAHLDRGTGDIQLLAKELAFKASLRRDQGRLEEAQALLREAIALYESLGEACLAAQERMSLGIVSMRMGEISTAAGLVRTATHAIPATEEPAFALGALHNLALCAAEAGSIQRALDLLTSLVPLYAASGDTVLQVRVGWVAGRILAHKEDWEGAACAFELVRREFTHRGLFFDAALAGLELALAYLHVGRVAEVKGLALEMVPVFEAQQIPREASAALLLFVAAARREALTVEDVAQLVADLKGRLAPPGRRGAQGRFVA